MRTRSFALAALAALASCVSVTAPVLAGKDTYMIGLGARGGFESDAELMAHTIQRAGEFCTAQRRVVEVVSTSSGGVQGWTPQSNQVLFRCVLPEGPPQAPVSARGGYRA